MKVRENNSDRPAVVVDNLSLSLGKGASRVDILTSVSLTMAKGETLGLIGASGSGKSTLLMVISGLEAPDSGTVTIDGQCLNDLDENSLARFRGHRIGIIFQSFHLIPTMTAEQNVAVPLEITGDPEALDRARAELRAVGLGERLSHYPSQLSGGEQQRVAIARALVIRPSLLIADEPTGNLDGARGRDIADLLFDRVRTSGTTLLLVTHDPSLAARCGRRLRMNSGQLAQTDEAPS